MYGAVTGPPLNVSTAAAAAVSQHTTPASRGQGQSNREVNQLVPLVCHEWCLLSVACAGVQQPVAR